MPEAARKRAAYEDLFGIPENMTGQIVDGELIATPRPSRKHVAAASHLGGKLIPSYRFGEGGGLGGRVILVEPEIGFGGDIFVSDLAGWKSDRFPEEEPHNWISVVPDWVCEVLSPGAASVDKVRKMPIYARYGVPYFWLVDPVEETLDAFRLEAGRWVLTGLYAKRDKVRADPFPEVEIDLGLLWLGTGAGPPRSGNR